MAGTIKDVANENNFKLILCNTDENSEKESGEDDK